MWYVACCRKDRHLLQSTGPLLGCKDAVHSDVRAAVDLERYIQPFCARWHFSDNFSSQGMDLCTFGQQMAPLLLSLWIILIAGSPWALDSALGISQEVLHSVVLPAELLYL